jgi:hypothetical protein
MTRSIVLLLILAGVSTTFAQEESPPLVRKVCVPVPTTLKVTRPIYVCKTVDYCVEWPDCLCWLFNKCDPNLCLKCKGPKTRKVLMKRLVTDEVPANKCEIREIPSH